MQIKATLAAAFALLLIQSPITIAKCVQGPKHAGDSCKNYNEGRKTCGPGNDGNVVSLLERSAFSRPTTSLAFRIFTDSIVSFSLADLQTRFEVAYR